MSAMTIGTPKSVLPKGTTAMVVIAGHHRETGREPVIEFVYVRRREIFLQQKFHGVGDRLEQARRARRDSVRADPGSAR